MTTMAVVDTGLWAGALDGLVARDATMVRLRELLVEGPRTAVVLGIPGAGKSALLAHVARAAAVDGWTVLGVTGHQSDQSLPFAVLVDLLASAGVAGALDQVGADDPLRLRLDVLGQLEHVAEEAPLLVVLDDVQWFDDSSLAVLGFVANRLASSQVSFVLAARGDVVPAGLAGHPVVDLAPLDDAEAVALLRRAGLDLSAITRHSVIDRAGGNPLALLELGRAVAAPESADREVLPSSVEASFVAELAALPDATRRVLLLAAAGASDLRVLGRVVRPGQLVVDLAPAESVGLVRVVDRKVRFRHPLARAAAYSSATTEQRLRAHGDLAAAYEDDVDRRIWHRAEATLVPDEEVAALLVQAAERARKRGANVEAARAMTRAAELSVERHDREERLLESISLGLPTGHFEWLADVARRVRDESDDPSVRARASHYIAYALARTSRQGAARRALLDALEQLVDVDRVNGWGSLTSLASLSYASGGDAVVLAAWLDRFCREAPVADPPYDLIEAAAKAWVRMAIDPFARPADLIELVRSAPMPDASVAPDLVAAYEMLLGAAAWLLDEPSVAAARLSRAVDVMERTRSPGQLIQTLVALGEVQFDLGAYDDVDQVGRLLVDLADAEQLTYTGDCGRALRARAAGVRGDVETVRRLAGEVLLYLDVDETVALEANVRVALGYAMFSHHDAAGCCEQLLGLFHPDGRPIHAHIAYRSLGDVVAAAVRAGRDDDVRRVLAVASERLADPGPRHRLALARARALLAGDGAEPFHAAATSDPAFAQWPFELASARLEYGAWLRRRHRPTAARGELQAAYDVFERVGARAWADLARSELRAAGVATAEPSTSAWDDLTAQERQVVRLAASGLTNRQIGASLYLSPRTVSAHLYNAFPKLGVTARSQLRDIVEARDAGA
jgi:DNA-binding CsgD family transcriptional regulator